MTMGLYAPEPDLYFSACARIEAVKAGIEIWRGQQPLSDTSAVALLDVLERGCKRLQEIANRKKADWDAGHKDR
ncbi:MAG TPA: hypothetical protein VGQ69_10455, partial [Gemmatimonadales bacterium]|nr:hypothetical protein [Gemmatimonadales bacterium]